MKIDFKIITIAEVAEAIDRLIAPVTTTSPTMQVLWGKDEEGVDQPIGVRPSTHTTTQPSLLHLLQNARSAKSRTIASIGSGGGGGGSGDPARVECLALLDYIDRMSAALSAGRGYEPVVGIEDRLKGWKTLARDDYMVRETIIRLTAEWVTAIESLLELGELTLRPHIYCLACDQVGSLELSTADGRITRMLCISCRTTWSEPEEVVVAVDWVRWATEHLTGPRHLVQPVIEYREPGKGRGLGIEGPPTRVTRRLKLRPGLYLPGHVLPRWVLRDWANPAPVERTFYGPLTECAECAPERARHREARLTGESRLSVDQAA